MQYNSKEWLIRNIERIVKHTDLKEEHFRYMGIDSMKKVLNKECGFSSKVIDKLCGIFNLEPRDWFSDIEMTPEFVAFCNEDVALYARKCYLNKREKYYSYLKKKKGKNV